MGKILFKCLMVTFLSFVMISPVGAVENSNEKVEKEVCELDSIGSEIKGHNPDFSDGVFNVNCCKRGPRGYSGPAGPTGPTGPSGSGGTINYISSNTDGINIAFPGDGNTHAIPFYSNQTSSGTIIHDTNFPATQFILPAGTYLIGWNLYVSANDNPATISVNLFNVSDSAVILPNPNIQFSNANTSSAAASTIVTFANSTTLELQAAINGNPNAYYAITRATISINQIAP